MPVTEGMLYSGIVIGAAVPVCVAAVAGSGYAKEFLRRRRSVRLRRGAGGRKTAARTAKNAEDCISHAARDERVNDSPEYRKGKGDVIV